MSSGSPVGSNLRARLAYLGLHQADVAAAFGVHRACVCRLVGRAPTHRASFDRLAAVLAFNPEVSRTVSDPHPAMGYPGDTPAERFSAWWVDVKAGRVLLPDPLRRSGGYR